MREPAPSTVRDDRRTFLRRRRRALAGSAGAVAALAALAALFFAPNRLSSLRVGDVALAWWVTGAVGLTGLLAIRWGFRGAGPVGLTAGTSRFTPLALGAVWGSPALWLGLPPLLLADGTRGLWAPAVVMVGPIVALLLLGTAWNRTGGLMAPASSLARSRWPEAWGAQGLMGSIEAIVAGLFVWAQLAAVREVGAMVGWPRAATVSVTVLVLGALLLPDLSRIRLTAMGGGLALAGLALPLLVIALATTTAWPVVWSTVASRARIAFGEGSHWTAEGATVRGSVSPLTLRFADEQRVQFAAGGSIVVEPREGGRLTRNVESGEEVALHPGDQLVVPGALPLRFEAGRRVPDAPDSGPDWIETSAPTFDWLWLVALAVTGCLGALGLPAGATPVGEGRLAPGRGAQLAALVVMAGAALTVGWSVYAAWLTPEVYAGGVGGAEVYTLASTMPGSRASGQWLTWLALGGLALGGAASALGSLQGLAAERRDDPGTGTQHLAVAVILGAGLLACLAPVAPWTVLLLALGLAASALAPAAVLACWSERATPQGAAAGATAGSLVYLLLVVGGALAGGRLPGGWGSVVIAAPAALAAPIHLVIAWLLRARGVPSPRSPLPPGLDGLAVSLPAGPPSD